MSMELLQPAEVTEDEVVLSVSDRSGQALVKAAVDRAKTAGQLAGELAEITGQAPGNYALYVGEQRLDPDIAVGESLRTGEADVRLVGDLTGN